MIFKRSINVDAKFFIRIQKKSIESKEKEIPNLKY